jgi:hypothetical protein
MSTDRNEKYLHVGGLISSRHSVREEIWLLLERLLLVREGGEVDIGRRGVIKTLKHHGQILFYLSASQ